MWLGCITGQGPEFGTRIGFLGKQHEKKFEERWSVIMALLGNTLLDESKFMILYISILKIALCRMLMCGWHWNWKLMVSRINGDFLYRISPDHSSLTLTDRLLKNLAYCAKHCKEFQ